MDVQREVKEKDTVQESEMNKEETEKELQEDHSTAQASEESVTETKKVQEGETVKEDEEVELVTEASKHIIGVVQESVVELVKGTDVEGKDAVQQEPTSVEKVGNIEEVKDIKEQTVHGELAEKSCMEKTEQATQGIADVEKKERPIKINVEEVKDVTHPEAGPEEQMKDVKPAGEVTKETSMQKIHPVTEVNVEQKEVTMEETTFKEQGEKESKAGVGEAALRCSPHTHTLPSPQNETENDSDNESFNFEDFEVVDALEEDEEEEEKEVGRGEDKAKPTSSTSRGQKRRGSSPSRRDKTHWNSSRSSHQHHSHSSHSRDRLRRGRDDAKDKSGGSSRSSRTTSRRREERSHHGQSRSQRRRDEDKSSDRHRQRYKSPRKENERDKTPAKKRSAEDEGRSSRRTKSVSDKQSSRKDTSLPKKDKETATQSHSEKSSRSHNTSTSRRQKILEVEGNSSTSRDATEQEKSGTQETSKDCNTPLGSGGSQTCLDRSIEKTETRANGSIEKKEEKVKTGTDSRTQVNNKNIEVSCEKLKVSDKELEVKEELEFSSGDLPVVNKDLELKVKNKELESSTKRKETSIEEVKSDLELNTVNTETKEAVLNSNELESNQESDSNVTESKTGSKHLEPQIDESTNNRKSELETKDTKENSKQLEPHRESEPQLEKVNMNIRKSEPEEPEPKMKTQTLGNTEQNLNEESEMMKSSKPSKNEPQNEKEEETSLQDTTSKQEMGISTRTRSARRRSIPMAAPRRCTRSQRKTAEVQDMDQAKKEVCKENIDKMEEDVSEEKTNKESKQVCSEEVCPQNTPLKQLVEGESVSEGIQSSIPLKNIASEEAVNEDSQRNALLEKTAEEFHKEEGNEDCKTCPVLAEEYKNVGAQTEDKNGRKGESSSPLQEEGGRCTGEPDLELYKKKEMLDVAAQGKTPEGKSEDTLKENSQDIPSEEDRHRSPQQEHHQDITRDQDKAGHLEQEDQHSDTPKKDSSDSIQQEESLNCISQEVEEENVTLSSLTQDKCETSPSTTKEEDKPTQAKVNDENLNICREDSHSKEDLGSRKILDTKSNKRPLESVEECAKRKRMESSAGLCGSELEKEEKEECKCKDEEIKEDSGRSDYIAPIKTQETDSSENVSKGSASKEVGRYSKVVVVGDARISLLAATDIRQQLKEVAQVLVVPNLTLNGILEVVQKKVVKEDCPRGILLLCLAGLHGTLVECRVPEECRAAGHWDMHEMVPAIKDDSLDPKFPKQLVKLKKKFREALGRGSDVLFFPVLPVDMANYNAVAAKHHFDASGHKLEHLSQGGTIHYRLLQQYRKAVEEVNGSSLAYVRLVPFEFCSGASCRKFTDELLQDGFNPTLELVERYIVPQLQRTIYKSNTLRFPQVVLVGDAHLGQVVRMQQQEGVEPCTFILQEEPGLRNLTPDSPAVQQLSGMCNALIFLSVTLKDAAVPTEGSEEGKAQCFLPHYTCEAFDNFLQEARRVDQMLHLSTQGCTVVTTSVMPFSSHTLGMDEAGKTSSCEKCTKIAKSVTLAIEHVSRMLDQKNRLPAWNLHHTKQPNKGGSRSFHQGSSLSPKVLQKAASSWEYFLSRSQAYVRTVPHVTITSILQDPQFVSAALARTHSNLKGDKRETQGSHSRDRTRTQGSRSKDRAHSQGSHSRNKDQIHNRDKEQTHNSHNRDKKQTHKSHSRDGEQTHNSHNRPKEQNPNRHKEQADNRDKEKAHNSCRRDKGQIHNSSSSRNKEQIKYNHSGDEEQWRSTPSASAFPALDDITSPASSLDRDSTGNLDSISTGDLSFTPSPCPSNINSPEDFVDLFHNESSQERNTEFHTKSQSLTPSPKPWRHSSTVEATPLNSPVTRLWSVDSRGRPSSSQRLWHTERDEPGGPFYQQGSYSPSRSREREHSSHTYPNPDAQVSRGRSRSIDRIRKVRSRSLGRSRSRSFDSNKRFCGRRSRSASPVRLPLLPQSRSVYRRSLSRSLSPHQRYRSIPGSASFTKDKRSTSRGRRSASRGFKRSISRGRRSVSRSRRSISGNRRSNSRERFVPRRRSLSRGRKSLSWGRRSISQGKRSTSRGRRSMSWGRSSLRDRSFSRSRRSASRGRRSISRSRRSISRSRRPISRSRRSISRSRRSISRNRRSISRSRRSISRSRRSISRSRRSISRSRRSISRGRRSMSRGRRSMSRGRRSVSRGRRSSRSSSLEHHSSVRFPVHTPSVQQEKTRKSMVKEALKTLRSVHEKECEKYRSNPTTHPDIGVEYRMFCEKKTQSILSLGGDPTEYNMAAEWPSFWDKRMEQLFLESWRVKRNQCLDMMDAHKKSPTLQPSSKVHCSYSPCPSSFSSSPSSDINVGSQQRSSKKRKVRGRSRSLQGNRRKKKNVDTRSPPISYSRDRQVEMSSVVSDRLDERSPENYTRPALPETGGRKEENYFVTRMPDMVRATTQEEWNEQHRTKFHKAEPYRGEPHSTVQDQWLQLPSSENPEVAISEAGRRQYSWKHTDSKMKDENLKNAFTGQSEWYKEYPECQKANASFANTQEGQACQGILMLDSIQPASKVANKAPSSQARELDSQYNLSHREGGPQETYSAHRDDNITRIFRSLAANKGDKPDEAHSAHRDDSITHIFKNFAAANKGDKPDEAYSAHRDNSITHIFKRFAANKGDRPDEAHSAYRNDSITHIFKNFAANKGDKPTTAESTRRSHEEEVSSIMVPSENTKIDVVNVLEVLTHLGDKLGPLYDPLQLVLERTKELQTNGTDPVAITNDHDSKLLLQMIQEKLQGILKDGKLNIIKKVIVQEAEQRLSVLLDLQEQRSLTGNLNLTQLARHCLNMDTTATVDFICKVLQCQGHTRVPEQQLMKLFMAVKAEQVKVVGDHDDTQAAATFIDKSHSRSHSNPEASLHLQVLGDSAGPLREASSARPLPQAETRTSAAHYDSPPRRGRQPCYDVAQTTHKTLGPDLQWEMSNYPQEVVTGGSRSATIKPSKTFSPSQPSSFQSWSPQSHTTLSQPRASTSNLSNPPQSTFREAKYHQKAPKYVSKKPIRITLPKHQPQKSIIGTFNPLGDNDSDREEEYE